MENSSEIDPKSLLIEKLKHLRDDYSDEIPAEMVHSSSPERMFKVRRSWFHSLLVRLEVGLMDGVIKDPEVVSKVEEFTQWAKEDFRVRDELRVTTREDIEKANDTISCVLNSLEPSGQ